MRNEYSNEMLTHIRVCHSSYMYYHYQDLLVINKINHINKIRI